MPNLGAFRKSVMDFIAELVPTFFYFSEFSKLPYSVEIRKLLKTDKSKLSDSELTALGLLRLAGAEDDYLLNPNYERRKRELENVANALTDDVLQYWSQNPELRVQPDITQRTEATPQGQQSVLHELKIRIWDNRHLLSLPFDEHSAGFQWFFSFLAAFSEFEHSATPIVILLDEPALGLHAKAQGDFLRFIDERLSNRCQVIYTTHSPFMVQPGALHRVRIVEDKGRTTGATVSKDILTTDKDTLFPLQGAIGYDLVQHLFVNQHNLVVEGISDYVYLSTLSSFLEAGGNTHLDPAWSVVPVGGVDLIPSFVALLGTHLNVTVLIDSAKKPNQRLENVVEAGLLNGKRLIAIGQITNTKTADIEDLFDVDDYLQLYNASFNAAIKASDLQGTDSIVNKIARHVGVDRFDHGRPAIYLLRNPDAVQKLSQRTIENFIRLFEVVNKTLGT
ncbi:MAG: hypothetical protein QOJ65_972 [Fimbriimonadaceae bacterium]|nr:hypothetical protein [Fimbriimonadaceae bacterium]